MARTTTPMW